MKRTLPLMLCASVAGWLLQATDARADATITLGLGAQSGSVDGFLQVPAGGNPGSSSLRRPSLHETGIDHVTREDWFASMQWQNGIVYAGYQPLSLKGQSLLLQPLASHSLSFPAGDAVALSTTLDSWHAGAGWVFHAPDERLAITPSAELAMLAFDARLSDHRQTTRRSYSKGAVRAGIALRYTLGPQLSLVAEGAASLPLRNTPQMVDFRTGLELRLLPGSTACQPILFVGGSSQSLDYEDRQTLPNHLHIHTGLLASTRLSVAF